MSETMTRPNVMPFDLALNVAVRHLSETVLPTGYDVVNLSGLPEDFTQDGYVKQHNGRLAVPSCSNPDHSLFADAEVENDFRAVMTWALRHPTTTEGHDHPGVYCPEQFANATLRVEEKLVEIYGDEPRTREWSRLLAIYYFTEIGFSVYSGSQSVNPRALFDMAMTTPMAQKPIVALREEFEAFMVKKLMEGGIGGAPKVLVVRSEEELNDLLEKLGMKGNVLPEDDSGRQNAPTTGALN